MKNTMTIMTRYSVGAVGLAFLCLAGSASAQMGGYSHPRSPQTSGAMPASSASPAANTASNARSSGGSLSAKDKRFINKAAEGGMMEVEGGRMATQNAKHNEVKRFGERMVNDHSQANNELKSIAASKGVQVPSSGKSMGNWKNDKEYMDMMVKDHEKDLAEFQAEANDGSDPDVKKFANKTSKIIQKHLNMAKEIQGKLK
jgi:putative membrane protein